MTIRTCLCLIISGPWPADDGAADDLRMLLGFKKTGFGAGRWVGLGGHVEPGEDPADAAAREVTEESGLLVDPAELTRMAKLTFVFPARPSWDQTAEVFVASEFAGRPAESDELIPRWFTASALPFDGMWDDARYWLPHVIAGRPVEVTITFASDCVTVARIEPALPGAASSPAAPATGTPA